jgi:putative inorganic carbon (hco3(-)) transporter
LKRFSLTLLYSKNRRISVLDWLLLSVLFLLIVALPLPFGSVEDSWIFLMEIFACVCFLLWVIKLFFYSDPQRLLHFRDEHGRETAEFRNAPFFHRFPFFAFLLRILTFGQWPKRNPRSTLMDVSESSTTRENFFNIFGYPVRNTGLEILGLMILAIFLIQMIPLPHFVSRILSPRSAELYSTAAAAAGTKLGLHSLSLDLFQTASKLLEYMAYFMIYVVLVNSVPSSRYYRAILVAFLVSVFFQATYGFTEFISGHQHIFAYKKLVNDNVATGTFINRNHYATYLEMSIPILLAVMIGHLDIPKRSTTPLFTTIRQIFKAEGGKVVLFLFILGTVLVSIVSSLSRSGILFTAVSTTAFLLLYGQTKTGLSKPVIKVALLLLVFAVLSGILWDPLYSRFARISEEFTAERARLFLYRDTSRIFFDFPFIGTGAGTFMQVFPMFRSFTTGDIYRYAHNDYLQFFSEAGIGALLIVIALMRQFYRRLLHILSRPSGHVVLLQLGSFCALLSLALHSLTDFGIHIPAIGMTGIAISSIFWRTPSGHSKII